MLAILFALRHRKKNGSGGIGSIVFAAIALIVGINKFTEDFNKVFEEMNKSNTNK